MSYSVEQMRKIKADLESNVYGEYQEACIKVNDVYNQVMSIGTMQRSIIKYIPPTGRAAVDTATDHIMGLGYRIDMDRYSDEEGVVNTIGLLRRLGFATIQQMAKTHRINVIRRVVKSAFLYGMGIFRGPLYVHRQRPLVIGGAAIEDSDWEAILKNTYPFHFQSRYPGFVMPDPSCPMRYLVDSYKTSGVAVKTIHPKWKTDMTLETEGNYWEFWSPGQKQYFWNNEPILGDKEMDNKWGFIPYEIIDAGFGADDPEDRMEHQIVSLLTPIISALKTEARIKTALAHKAVTDAVGFPAVDRPVKPPFKMPAYVGDLAIHPPQYNYRNVLPTEVSGDTWRIAGMVDADEQLAVPRILQGLGSKGATSGYQESQRTGQGRLKFDGVKQGLETSIARILGNELRLIKWIGKPIGVHGQYPEGRGLTTIHPDKVIPALQQYYITLEPANPEDRDRRIYMGLRLFQAKALPWETICDRYFGLEPTNERLKLMIQEVLDNPAIKMGLALRTASRARFTEVMELIKEKQWTPTLEGKQLPATADREQRQLQRDTGEGELMSEEEMGGANFG